ncbi:uncharacterized protein PgNI_07999 [Pyricularia grisea]|uniref:Uncharacterized protein n=1 Tax=Pyricularia grisea TaxID=148305 RepID=A0A6P8AWU8_PYRGI|nr:uncharacterized protein PgNI_07999 [Pyricularia grisea]TLD06701.1 hypothetical protein PgNI_07999 [Pyricularia grisea]
MSAMVHQRSSKKTNTEVQHERPRCPCLRTGGTPHRLDRHFGHSATARPLADPTITHVAAVNRSTSAASIQNERTADFIGCVTFHMSQFGQPLLGLTEAIYE